MIHARTSQFAADDPYTDLLLGLAAFARNVQQAIHSASRQQGAAPSPESSTGADPALDTVLGLYSVALRLDQLLVEIGQQADSTATVTAATATAPALTGLLR